MQPTTRRGDRHLPGYGDRKEHIDQKNKPTGHGLAGLDIGHGRAHRLDADRRRKVARALIHEMPPARSQKCPDDPETKPHGHMRGGVAHLGHGRHHQERLRGDHPDDDQEQHADGDLQPDEGEGSLDIEHHHALRAFGSLGCDDQVEQGQQRRDAHPLRQRGDGDRQQHRRAAHRIGRIEIAEQFRELADAFDQHHALRLLGPRFYSLEPIARATIDFSAILCRARTRLLVTSVIGTVSFFTHRRHYHALRVPVLALPSALRRRRSSRFRRFSSLRRNRTTSPSSRCLAAYRK